VPILELFEKKPLTFAITLHSLL